MAKKGVSFKTSVRHQDNKSVSSLSRAFPGKKAASRTGTSISRMSGLHRLDPLKGLASCQGRTCNLQYPQCRYCIIPAPQFERVLQARRRAFFHSFILQGGLLKVIRVNLRKQQNFVQTESDNLSKRLTFQLDSSIVFFS